MNLKQTFGHNKPIIGMVHLPPLPSAPLYDTKGGMKKIIESCTRDIEALQGGGIDAIMFGNEGDRPYLLKASPVTLASMAFVIGELKRLINVPFGVNYLWDPVATVSLAVASGAASRARSSPASMIPTWAYGRRTPQPPCASAPIANAPT